VEKRYKERYPIYNSVCDCKVDADCQSEEVAEKIIGDFTK
jgi:shikimate kinase